MTEVQLWFCRELQPGRELPPAARATFHSLTTLKLTLRMSITTFKIQSALITIYNNADNSGFLIFQACTVAALPCQQQSHQKTKSNSLKINTVKLLLIYVVFTSQKPNQGNTGERRFRKQLLGDRERGFHDKKKETRTTNPKASPRPAVGLWDAPGEQAVVRQVKHRWFWGLTQPYLCNIFLHSRFCKSTRQSNIQLPVKITRAVLGLLPQPKYSNESVLELTAHFSV